MTTTLAPDAALPDDVEKLRATFPGASDFAAALATDTWEDAVRRVGILVGENPRLFVDRVREARSQPLLSPRTPGRTRFGKSLSWWERIRASRMLDGSSGPSPKGTP